MTCPRCQSPNPEGARFCEECGVSLELRCSRCAETVGTGKKFCRSCGGALGSQPAPAVSTSRFPGPRAYTPAHLAERILTSKGALEGERKQVTVLFADLKGSMELLADRDPEEARQLLDPVLERMMDAVHHYEGTVNHDRLAPEAKRLLQAAAVIGKDVPMPLLLAIADAPEPAVRAELTHLQAAEFLYETRLFPDLEYTFKHALTHDVAYGGLLHDRQRALHARIAEAIERLSTDRLAEQAERLAHHALRGELWEKAVAYLRQAGLRALARAANREAIPHLEQALATLRRLPETRETTELTIDIHIDLRNALSSLSEWARVGEHLHEAEVVVRTLGDQHRSGGSPPSW